jgi:hypothetical protein
MTFNELVTNIRNYTDVDANVFSESVINTFVTMAENRILRDIDLDVFKREDTGALSANNRFLTAPNEILTHRYMMVVVDGDRIFLDFRDQSFMREYWPDYTQTGVPKYYSVWDQNTFSVAPTPGLNYTVQMGYIYRPPQISSTNQTSWISTNAPEALLYACLIQAYSYTKGPPEMMAYFENSYKQAIQGLGIEQNGRRRRDEYRDGMLRIPLPSPSPGP